MMVEDAERLSVRSKRRRRKALYFTSQKERFRLSMRKKNANKGEKKRILNTIEETIKKLDFDTISMATEVDEGANNAEHADDCISESEMKTSSENTTNKEVRLPNMHM